MRKPYFLPQKQRTDMAELPPSHLFRKQALDWLIRQRSGDFSAADRAAFERWLAQSPAHGKAFESVRTSWAGLPRPEAELIDARRQRATRRVFPLLGAAVAATLMLAAGLTAWNGWPVTVETVYRTAKGERQVFVLPDGSEVALNTDTELAVHYGWTTRSLELKRGEALFSVAPGKWQPFEVIAAGGRIRDIGTRFDVSLRPQGNRISVLDGAVKLHLFGTGENRRADAGQMMAYNAAAVLSEPAAADIDTAVAWQTGKLVFRATPLKEALADLGRYHPVDFVIADPQLEHLPISGVFDSGNIELFLTTLEAVLAIDIRRTGADTIVLERRPGKNGAPASLY